MRIVPALVMVGIVSASLVAPVRAEGNVNVVGGPRYFNDGSWDPVQDQSAWGLALDVGKKFWRVNFALAYHDSSTTSHTHNAAPVEEFDLQGRLQELDFGIMKAWDVGHHLRPFVGGGLGFVEASSRATIQGLGSTHDSQNGAGAWLDTGVYWRLGGHFNVGFDARILLGSTVKLFGFDRSADYRQIGALVGWGWPAAKPPAPEAGP